MKYLILMGSPRKSGNTQTLTAPFADELKKAGHEVEEIWLYGKEIHGCEACRVCQKDWMGFGCKFNDDMQNIFPKVLECDILVLATPIYCWSCTAPMKAALDRLMYGMNKFYGEEKGPSLWKGKHVAIITTCGYRPEKGADLFEESIKRYCKHSSLIYDGMLAERDLGYKAVFASEEKVTNARAFAAELMRRLNKEEEN